MKLKHGIVVAAGALAVAATPSSHAAAAATVSPLAQPVTVGVGGNEPIVKRAPDGTLYISALEYLYVSTDAGATWHRSPGNALLNPQSQGGVNLNTDSSIDVDPGNRLYLTFDTPYAGTTTTCYSDDRAQTLTCNPTTLPGGTDRMWLTAPSKSVSYLTSNEGLYHTLFFSSTDRGATYVVQKSTDSALNPNDGPPILDPTSSLVFQPFVNNASNVSALDEELSGPVQMHVWDPTSPVPAPAAELNTPLQAGAALTDAAFTPDGTLYVVSEDPIYAADGTTVVGKDVQVIRSSDRGVTWTKLPPIPGTTTGTAAFTWVAAGSNGHIGVIYYQTSVGGRADAVNGSWDAKWAETTDATDPTPSWTVRTLDTGVHTGAICTTAGCTGTNRFAGDFITATFDSADQPQLTWMRENKGTAEIRFTAAAAQLPTVVGESPAAAALVLGALAGIGVGSLRTRRRRSASAAGGVRQPPSVGALDR
ncbi:MAG: hypothetical protein ACYDAC_06545 [Candidatus Dormibacteria bacterium]